MKNANEIVIGKPVKISHVLIRQLQLLYFHYLLLALAIYHGGYF